jgi:hypothetical protein
LPACLIGSRSFHYLSHLAGASIAASIFWRRISLCRPPIGLAELVLR